nr:ribonuclease H-like domain-containing protein [Tanacetum cinerariifolium]
MVVAAKLLVLNPGEFELWKIRIKQYFLMTDYALWEVIVNGDTPLPMRTVDGVEQSYPPTTAEEKLARTNKLKARGTLLTALPNEHQLKFNSYKNAKSLMEAIEKSFGGNKDSGSTNQAHGSNSANTDSLSDVVIYSLSANQSNSPQLDNEDLQQIDADDLKETDLKWQMAMLTMRARRFLKRTGRKVGANGSKTIGFDKTKLECYNCHKRGHFIRECRALRENMHKETVRRNVTIKTTDANALVAQDGFGYDWIDQAKDGPTNFALMAYTSSCSSSCLNSNTEVSTYSKACLKSYENLKENYDNLSKDYKKSQFNVGDYKAGLESVKARLDVYRKNEAVFEDMLRDNALTELRKKFEKAKKERDDLKLTLEKFENSSKNIGKLSPSYTGNFMPSKPDLILGDMDEYVVSESVTSVPVVATNEAKTTESKPKSVSGPIIEDWVSDSEDENETETKSKQRKPSFAKVEFVKPNEQVKTPRETVKLEEHNKQAKHPRKTVKVLEYTCKHNKGLLNEIDGGYVAFGGDLKGGKITGKGKIRTCKLDFKDVYFVKELKFNISSVSQMCDKKNSVLSTDTECVVLSPDFKLLNESQVLLRVPRKNNMYSFDLKNVVPLGGLTCLFAKATLDESNLWHRRLGHINFKTMNKLVRGNLVRGLPLKIFKNNHTCVACQK